MILLPIQSQPLQTRYSRPFTIEKKINDVDYMVKTLGRRNEKCLCHINMLKLYQEGKLDQANTSCSAVCSVATGLIMM